MKKKNKGASTARKKINVAKIMKNRHIRFGGSLFIKNSP
jgi:hypothetical protein